MEFSSTAYMEGFIALKLNKTEHKFVGLIEKTYSLCSFWCSSSSFLASLLKNQNFFYSIFRIFYLLRISFEILIEKNPEQFYALLFYFY